MPSSIISNLVNLNTTMIQFGNHHRSSTANSLISSRASTTLSSASSKREISGELIEFYSNAIQAIEEENLAKLRDMVKFRSSADDHHDLAVPFSNNNEEDSLNLIELLDADSLGSLLLKLSELNTAEGGKMFSAAATSASQKSLLTNQLEISIELINLGCNVNFRNPESQTTSLMMAARNNNIDLLELMLTHSDVKVNLADKYGWTALFYASYFGHLDCSKLLLSFEANLHLKDLDKMSCLIWASGRGHLEVVELLLQRGASVNDTDGYNTSPLIWACRKGDTRIVDTLLKNGALINKSGMYGWTPLIVTVKNNHWSTLVCLLEHGRNTINLNACDGELMSPLMIAAYEGFVNCAMELIKANANVNQVDKHGQSALIFATKIKCQQLIEALIKAGAHIEHAGLDERNAIHWSIIGNDVVACRLFLQQNIDLNYKTSSGETYLMLAAKHFSWDVIKLLEEYNLK